MQTENRISNPLRINFTGVSGIGKTTLAKWVAEEFKIPFLSGSYSDLVPSTKDMPHKNMITQDVNTVYAQDMQVLNLRNKLFQQHPQYVSDRSYLDSAAYLINKLSHRIKECDTESFLEICHALTGVQITHLIFMPFTYDYVKRWEMEDNNKRVLNRYYQWEVSTLMYRILYEMWGFSRDWENVDACSGFITIDHQDRKWTTRVLILRSMNLEVRKGIIKRWITEEQ